MKSLQPRERMMLWGLGLFLVVALFYVLVYSPRTSTNADLAAQLATDRAEMATLQAQAKHKDALEQQIAAAQGAIQTFEAKLPGSKDVPNLLVQLDALAHQSGVDLVSIKPSPLKPATAPQAAVAQPPSIAGPTAQAPPPKQSAPQNTSTLLAGYQEFTVSIRVQGTFPTVLAFVRGLETFPRFLAISDVAVRPAPPAKDRPSASSQPLLAMDVTTTAYVVPAPGTGGAR